MSIYVNTNTSSLMVQRNLSKATADLKSSMQKLSTGLRINNAGDDAAGLSLSEKLKAQIGAADVTKSNAQTGINMLQVADGDLSIINDNLQRMRDLAVQSANGVYSTSERRAIDQEIQLRMAEINRIAKSSSFSELNLLDGSLSGADKCLLQIGVYSGLSQNTIDISSALGKATCTALGINGNSVTTATLARTFMDNLDKAIVNMANRRAVVGASINRLNSTVDRIDIRKENLQASNSIIRDTDVAAESAKYSKASVLQQASTALLQQANQTPGIALSLI